MKFFFLRPMKSSYCIVGYPSNVAISKGGEIRNIYCYGGCPVTFKGKKYESGRVSVSSQRFNARRNHSFSSVN